MHASHRTILATVVLAVVSCPASAAGDDLAWLAGRWCGGDGGTRIEEVWLEPAGGHMLGVSRMTKNDRLASFEFLRIGPADGVTTYFAQPGGRPPTAFALGDAGTDRARFENPAHDFPQRIEYRRDGDRLHAEIAGPGEDGKEQVIGVDYVRCDG